MKSRLVGEIVEEILCASYKDLSYTKMKNFAALKLTLNNCKIYTLQKLLRIMKYSLNVLITKIGK